MTMITETVGDVVVTRWPLVVDAPVSGVPQSAPRWAGKLALRRHVLTAGVLTALAPTDDRPTDNLLAQTVAWRDTLPAGEQRDMVDAALNDAETWLRSSDAVATISSVLGLTSAQVDDLFTWTVGKRL